MSRFRCPFTYRLFDYKPASKGLLGEEDIRIIEACSSIFIRFPNQFFRLFPSNSINNPLGSIATTTTHTHTQYTPGVCVHFFTTTTTLDCPFYSCRHHISPRLPPNTYYQLLVDFRQRLLTITYDNKTHFLCQLIRAKGGEVVTEEVRESHYAL